jgi:alkylation response protein AidB-like acyl-CoA dehydrogenase
MDLRFTDEDEVFARAARTWLAENLAGEFLAIRGRGGPGDEHTAVPERRAWERQLGRAGWTGLGWPTEHGGRGASLIQEVIFHEEYARAGGPGRLGHIGQELVGPTILAFGTEAQKRRFLPPILAGDELWCQGYSEPNAGSDLANVQTRAVLEGLEGDAWSITGQKIWTSLAQTADWCFALCRTDPEAPKHRGLSYLLVPMRQAGISVRPITQMLGTSEFCEVFFDGARTAAENVVGPVNGGWKVAMATLGFERGVSTLGQQVGFENELREVIERARASGAARDPVVRQRLADAWIELRIMRFNALRTLSATQRGELGREGLINKLYWATWHRSLGKLAMDLLGPAAEIMEGAPFEGQGGGYDLTALQRLFLFSRADTIYAGTNEIQRNIIGERALGLPAEPRAGKA